MSLRLLVTSGRGPAECRIALSRVVRLLRGEAEARGLDLSQIDGPPHPQGHGPASVVLDLDGPEAVQLAAAWAGTIQWIAQSPVRPHHKRKNWFVSVSELPSLLSTPSIREGDVRFEAFRAGGPGGQHQNTTDSAVRTTHGPTGLRLVAREERSQHPTGTSPCGGWPNSSRSGPLWNAARFRTRRRGVTTPWSEATRSGS